MARHLRLLGVLTSLATLATSFLYNLAITRKLPVEDLGLVTLLNASTAFSLLPNAVLGFALPRITARDGGLDLRAVLGATTALFAASAGLTLVYLAAVWGRLGGYGPLVASTALATELFTYISSVSSSVLMVKDRGRFLYSSLLQALTKLAVIGGIYAAKWSVAAVLWGSVIVTAAPALYGLYYASAYRARSSLRRYLREIAHASWVPLMGYALNSFRSLDAALIGVFGTLEQIGLWYVFFMLSKPYAFSSIISNVTYGELLEGRERGLYKDLLMVMSLSTAISMTYIFFGPYYVNFLRPGQPQYIDQLFFSLVLWSIANVLGNLNYFLTNIMQGVDKRDIQAGEIRARSYIGSLVLYAHLAELVFTAVYLGSLIPLVELFKAAGAAYYAISGVVAASLSANAAALAFRLAVIDKRSKVVDWRLFLADYLPPLAASSALLYLISGLLRMPLSSSVLISLAEAAIAFLITAATYVGLSAALSRNFRDLLTAALRGLSSILGKLGER